MGPKGSSFMMRAEFGTSASTVGSKKKPLRAMRLPPASSRAPCFSDSSMMPCTAGSRRACASGPMRLASSMPSPTGSAFARAANPSQNFG